MPCPITPGGARPVRHPAPHRPPAFIAALLLVLCMLPAARAHSALNQADRSELGERFSVNDPRVIGSFAFIELENEDIIRGVILRVTDGVLVLQHEILGDTPIGTNRINAVYRQGSAAAAAPEPPQQVQEGPQPADPLVLQEPEADQAPPQPKPSASWSSQIELGVNGSQGNAERFNSSLAFRTNRRTEGTRLSLDANWRVNTTRGDRTANRLTFNGRHDWNLPESKWTLFVQGGAEFDEFRDFDARTSGGAGFNYRFIENDDTQLSSRIGFGFSREIGGPNQDFVPELITGVELTHRLNDRQRIVASGELFPDLDETGEFRSVVRARWELRLDEKHDVSLTVGLEHRYDTQSTNEQQSDVDYFMRIVWGF